MIRNRLWKKVFILAYGSRGVREQGEIAAKSRLGSRSRKLRGAGGKLKARLTNPSLEYNFLKLRHMS